ncbi:hypothetical protein C9374_008424 [Naegleria lovaniensis]|uniref:Uncharacterized protein n=1 Tax=Naegleria lovaniensis TaxID=51637 RepID=A0AA88KHK8_NAELO|nr:uncharacterized protein C9374_008424 [Naegleria lovaniensis]KAG2378281.1 hypothetical protein C9374_008424 [Naegleria lovaniensis]
MSSTQQQQQTINYEKLPLAFGIFTGLWLVAGLAWIAHVAYYYYFKKISLSLHRIIILIPLAKLVHTSTSIYLFNDCASNGNRCGVTPTIIANIANVIFNICLFGGLLYLGKGVSITRTAIEASEKRSMIWNLVCLALCEIAKVFNVFFIFPLFVIYVIIFGHALSSIGMNIKLLDHRYMEVEAPLILEVNIMKSPTFMKMNLFKKLRFLLFLFLGSYIAIFALMVVFMFAGETQNDFWIQLVAAEALQFTVCGLVAMLIRIRDFSEYQQVDERVEQLRRDRQQRARNDIRDLLRTITTAPSSDETERQTVKFATKTNPITNSLCLCVIENPVSKENVQGKYALAVEASQ